MTQLINKNRKGFTIIEVMIVLAIAGLIMVVVFLAIPQLQRSQRNNARQAVMNRYAAEVNNFASNNSGAIPTAIEWEDVPPGGFYTRYIASNANSFQDPSTGAAMLHAPWTTDAAVNVSTTAFYGPGRICAGENTAAGTARNFVVMTMLEGGARYCLDNG
jgi:prepilin-type N-terminal cleavage/methylation domain-containing protein